MAGNSAAKVQADLHNSVGKTFSSEKCAIFQRYTFYFEAKTTVNAVFIIVLAHILSPPNEGIIRTVTGWVQRLFLHTHRCLPLAHGLSQYILWLGGASNILCYLGLFNN